VSSTAVEIVLAPEKAMCKLIAIPIAMEVWPMRTVQLTLDEELVEAVDKAAAEQGSSRSRFTRDALRAALARARERALEQKHREGYRRKPVKRGEFRLGPGEPAWGEP
jgi:predicted transcriptional regulator